MPNEDKTSLGIYKSRRLNAIGFARVAEQADAADLKSADRKGRTGSIPVLRTINMLA